MASPVTRPVRHNAAESDATPERVPSATDATPLQSRHLTYLRTEGYVPEVDEDGDIRFKREGFTYYIIVDEEDPEYFRILFPGIWIVEDPAEHGRVLAACSEVSRRTKVVKAYLRDDRVNLSVEMLLPDPKDVPAVFPRSMTIFSAARDRFIEEMSPE